MEKYTRFADATTGINPFLPTWAALPKESWMYWIPRTIISVFLFPFRLIVLTLGVILYLLLHAVTYPLCCLPRIQRYTRLFLEYVPLRLVLLSLGVLSVTEKNAEARRLKLATGLKRSASQKQRLKPHHNVVLISNLTNVLEIVYLTLRYQPQFVAGYANKSFGLVSSLEMMIKALFHDGLYLESSDQQTTTLGRFNSLEELIDDISSKKYGPVVIFPEMFKSNGTVILQWDIDLLCPKAKFKQDVVQKTYCDLCATHCRILGFHYQPVPGYSLPHTTFSPTYHICCLLFGHFCYTMTLIWTSQQQVEELLSPRPNASTSTLTPEGVINTFRQTMSRMLPGVQLVDVPGARLPEFSAYFTRTQNVKYRKA